MPEIVLCSAPLPSLLLPSVKRMRGRELHVPCLVLGGRSSFASQEKGRERIQSPSCPQWKQHCDEKENRNMKVNGRMNDLGR